MHVFLYAPTLKEDPAEAVVLQSHRLLLRAGMIRKTCWSVLYLPLAWRSL